MKESRCHKVLVLYLLLGPGSTVRGKFDKNHDVKTENTLYGLRLRCPIPHAYLNF